MINDQEFSPSEYQQLSTYLDQGKLVEYYDIEGTRVGIRSLKFNEYEEVFYYFKSQVKQEFIKEVEVPLVFARKFLYSIDEYILTPSEKEKVIQELSYNVVYGLFKKWRKLQQKAQELEEFIEEYIKTPDSRLKYKLCKLFQVTPDSSVIKGMDPLTQKWLIANIVQDEKELFNNIYDKIEYIVSFYNPDAARRARNRRLMDQGEKVDDPNLWQSTDFDENILSELKEIDPNLDTENIKSFDDYVNFINKNHSFDKEIKEAMDKESYGLGYTEEEKIKLVEHLEKEKGSLLTETEKELTIYKLDNGEMVILEEIIREAADIDIVSNASASDILKDIQDLDNA